MITVDIEIVFFKETSQMIRDQDGAKSLKRTVHVILEHVRPRGHFATVACKIEMSMRSLLILQYPSHRDTVRCIVLSILSNPGPGRSLVSYTTPREISIRKVRYPLD